MRSLLMLAVLLGSFATAFADDSIPGATNAVPGLPSQSEAAAAPTAKAGRVVKVLPLYLDLNGHDAISPSLFDRDAYQAHLRQHTNEVSAIRFDVLWKATSAKDAKLKLRAELRGIADRGLPSQTVLETEIAPGTFSSWTSLPLGGDDLKKFGSLVAWRVTLWNGDQLIGEQKSFLW